MFGCLALCLVCVTSLYIQCLIPTLPFALSRGGGSGQGHQTLSTKPLPPLPQAPPSDPRPFKFEYFVYLVYIK